MAKGQRKRRADVDDEDESDALRVFNEWLLDQVLIEGVSTWGLAPQLDLPLSLDQVERILRRDLARALELNPGPPEDVVSKRGYRNG